jgi:hypothetical protein
MYWEDLERFGIDWKDLERFGIEQLRKRGTERTEELVAEWKDYVASLSKENPEEKKGNPMDTPVGRINDCFDNLKSYIQAIQDQRIRPDDRLWKNYANIALGEIEMGKDELRTLT